MSRHAKLVLTENGRTDAVRLQWRCEAGEGKGLCPAATRRTKLAKVRKERIIV